MNNEKLCRRVADWVANDRDRRMHFNDVMVSVLVDSLPRLDLEARREVVRFIWPDFLDQAREIAFKKLVALAFRPH